MNLRKLPPDCISSFRLTEITLNGIGSYLRPTKLEIKPLTILCGTNGAGKSTWIKALSCIKDAVLPQDAAINHEENSTLLSRLDECFTRNHLVNRILLDRFEKTKSSGGTDIPAIYGYDSTPRPRKAMDILKARNEHAKGPTSNSSTAGQQLHGLQTDAHTYCGPFGSVSLTLKATRPIKLADESDITSNLFFNKTRLCVGDLVHIRFSQHFLFSEADSPIRTQMSARLSINGCFLETTFHPDTREPLLLSGIESQNHLVAGDKKVKPREFSPTTHADLCLLLDRILQLFAHSFFRLSAIRNIIDTLGPGTEDASSYESIFKKYAKTRFVGENGSLAHFFKLCYDEFPLIDPRVQSHTQNPTYFKVPFSQNIQQFRQTERLFFDSLDFGCSTSQFESTHNSLSQLQHWMLGNACCWNYIFKNHKHLIDAFRTCLSEIPCLTDSDWLNLFRAVFEHDILTGNFAFTACNLAPEIGEDQSGGYIIGSFEMDAHNIPLTEDVKVLLNQMRDIVRDELLPSADFYHHVHAALKMQIAQRASSVIYGFTSAGSSPMTSIILPRSLLPEVQRSVDLFLMDDHPYASSSDTFHDSLVTSFFTSLEKLQSHDLSPQDIHILNELAFLIARRIDCPRLRNMPTLGDTFNWWYNYFFCHHNRADKDIGLYASIASSDTCPVGYRIPNISGNEYALHSPDAAYTYTNQFLTKGDWPGAFSAGFHQIVPMIVQAGLMRMYELLAVENPEVHLHPGLQLNLMEFFIENALIGKFVLIETHSDLMIRRVMRAITEEKIPQSWVSILFVDVEPISTNTGASGSLSSKVEQLTLDDRGVIMNWPPGFLEDDENESKALMRALYGDRFATMEENENE